MKNLTLIIPAKNESESLPFVLEELRDFSCKIIISLQEDDLLTINSIKKFNVNIINQNERGYGNALINGINNCETEYFCVYNADGSFEKNDLSKMYNLIATNDFVFASRYLKNGGSEDDTVITYIGNIFFSTLG